LLQICCRSSDAECVDNFRLCVTGVNKPQTRVATLRQHVRAVGVGANMNASKGNGLVVEALLDELYTGGINATISWLQGGRIEVRLGDAWGGYAAATEVDSFAEAAEWLRDKALIHCPRSKFARQYAAFPDRPNDQHRPDRNADMHWSEIDLLDLGHLLTRGASIREIASFLHRSSAEVRDKIAALGRASER
jgi:hypothetical protein